MSSNDHCFMCLSATRYLLTCLVYAASVSSDRPRTRSFSHQADDTDQPVAAPWRSPCSGEVVADFRLEGQTSSTPRLRRHWARRALAWSRHLATLMGNMLRDADLLTANALAAYVSYLSYLSSALCKSSERAI